MSTVQCLLVGEFEQAGVTPNWHQNMFLTYSIQLGNCIIGKSKDQYRTKNWKKKGGVLPFPVQMSYNGT